MCREHRGLIAFASLFGLVQSVLWFAATAAVFLIYYCVLLISPYENKSDFFRVTLVKLYFEGPKCIPDGKYLGKFNEDYRSSVTLIGREVMMFVLIAYVILSIIYFVLSILLYLKRRTPKKRLFLIGWSVITLVTCGLDLLLTFTLVSDSFTLMHYFSKDSELHDVMLGSIPFIPLLLAFVSSRFVIIWIWNFFIGIYFFFLGLCGSMGPRPSAQQITLKVEDKAANTDVRKVAEKAEETPKAVRSAPQRPTGDEDGTLSLVSENYRGGFPSDVLRAYPDYNHYRRSMEAVTKFSEQDRMPREYHPHNWCYEPSSEMPPYTKPHSQPLRMRGETNEGYVEEEEERGFERSVDFQHNLRNFETGQKKIRLTRPPPGKPVGIPVPPPLPTIGSCNC